MQSVAELARVRENTEMHKTPIGVVHAIDAEWLTGNEAAAYPTDQSFATSGTGASCRRTSVNANPSAAMRNP